MKKIALLLLVFLASCKKEKIKCKIIDRIVGNSGIYSLHFNDGTSYFNLRDTSNYRIGDEFCDVESEFIFSMKTAP